MRVTTTTHVDTLSAPDREFFASERFQALFVERLSVGQAIEFKGVPVHDRYDTRGFRNALAAVLPRLERNWNTNPAR